MRSRELIRNSGSADRLTSPRRAIVFALLIVVATLVTTAGVAVAHTDLVSTAPTDGAVLAEPVTFVDLEFSGPLDTDGTTVRVLDSDGDGVSVRFTHITDTVVRIEPETPLDGGRFVVLWSVRSVSDGHELDGTLGFEIATAPPDTETGATPGTITTVPTEPVDDDTVTPSPTDDPVGSTITSTTHPTTEPIRAIGEARGDGDRSSAWDVVGWLGRWIVIAGAVVGVGAVAFTATSLVGSDAEVRRAGSWIRVGGIMLLIGTFVALTASGMADGDSLLTSVRPWTWIDDLPPTQAYAMVLRLAGAIAMLQSPALMSTTASPAVNPPAVSSIAGSADDGSVATTVRTEGVGHRLAIQHEWLIIVGTVLVLASFGLDGHTMDAGIVGMAASMGHVAAAGVWAGGLIVMEDLLIRRHRIGAPLDTRSIAIRFSRVASVALTVTALAGVALGWLLVDAPSDLWSGRWGRILLAKVAVVAVVVTIGAYNHFRVVPHLGDPGSPGPATLRHTVITEVALMAAVIALTAALIVSAP